MRKARGAVACAFTAAAFLALAPLPGLGEEAADRITDFLERVERAEAATYTARQLVVYFGQPQSAAVLDVDSSEDGEFVRAESGARVTRVWRRPGVRIVSGEGVSLESAEPVSVPLRPKAILAKYEVEVGSPRRLLGVEVVPLELRRRSDRALVESWLVDPASGIVYQRRLYGRKSELVGMSTVIEMQWGRATTVEPFDPGPRSPARVQRASGRGVPRRLAEGYRFLGAYRLSVSGQAAEQWVYGDGLHALSVFRLAGGLRAPGGFKRADLGGFRGWVGPGPGTWAWEGRGQTYVMVAEEPALDPVEMLAPFPHGGPSVLARLGSMWARLYRAARRILG